MMFELLEFLVIPRVINGFLGGLIISIPTLVVVMSSLKGLKDRLHNGIEPERLGHLAIKATPVLTKRGKVRGYVLSTSEKDSFALFRLASGFERAAWFRFKIRWMKDVPLEPLLYGAKGISSFGHLRVAWGSARSTKGVRVSKDWVKWRSGMYKDGALHFITLGWLVLGEQERDILTRLGTLASSRINGALYSWALEATGVGEVDSGKSRYIQNVPDKVWDVYDGVIDNPWKSSIQQSSLVDKLRDKGVVLEGEPEEEVLSQDAEVLKAESEHSELSEPEGPQSLESADQKFSSDDQKRFKRVSPVRGNAKWYSYGPVPSEVLKEISTINLLCPGVTAGELYCNFVVIALELQFLVFLFSWLGLSVMIMSPLMIIFASVISILINFPDLHRYKKYCAGLK